MKNKIDRMKTPAMHLSKRTVALILSVIMLVSSIATGSMLNTFAAYIKDNAAKTDAIADAASEGSAIAESAIPSEDADAPAQADDADEKPDLSGFEENEIVRGMKQDLANTAAAADLASVGYSNGGYVKGSWDSWATPDASKGHDMTSGYTVSLKADTTYEFCFVAKDNEDVFKKDATISGSVTKYDFPKGAKNNAKLHTTVAGNYTFKFNSWDGGDTSMRVDITFPEDTTPDTWTVVGNNTSLFGTEWAPTATANDMTQSGSTWTWTKNNVQLTAGTKIEYKIAKNHAWDTTVPADATNLTKTVSATGTYNVTVTYNGSGNPTMDLTPVTKSTLTVQSNIDHATVTATYNGETAQEGGTISDIPQGATVNVSVTPDRGYQCAAITCTPSATTSGSMYSFTLTMPGEPTTVNATINEVTLKKIYFNNSYTLYGSVYAYVYDKSDSKETYQYLGKYPGTTMTKLDNSNIWYIEVPSDVDYVKFVSGEGNDTGEMKIPWVGSGESPTYTYPKYTAPYGHNDAPNKANGGTWGNYIYGSDNKRTNEYTVTDGTTMGASNLFKGITATMYDYYTDGEIAASAGTASDTGAGGAPNGWIKGIANDEYTWKTNVWKWNPYTNLNSALSAYANNSSQPKYDVSTPLYFGNLNTWSDNGNGNAIGDPNIGRGNKDTVEGYHGWNLNANNSIQLGDSSNAVTGLSGKTLANDTIHYYESTDTNENGAPMAMFDEDFLSGENNQNKALASILRTSSFPVRKATVKTIYCDLSDVSSWWKKDDRSVYAYYWNASGNNKIAGSIIETNLIAFQIPSDSTGFKFYRARSIDADWDNETPDLSFQSSNNKYKVNSTFKKGDDGTWSKQTGTTVTTHTYYEYDSTNGKDNAFITNINKTEKTANIDYYADSAQYVQSSNDKKGFFPFDYNNVIKSSDTYPTNTIYVDVSSVSGANYYGAYLWKSGQDGTWTILTQHSGNTYKFDNSNGYDYVILTRGETEEKAKDFDQSWNRTGNVTIPTGSDNKTTIKLEYDDTQYDRRGMKWSYTETSGLQPYTNGYADSTNHLAHDLGFGMKLTIPFNLNGSGDSNGINEDGTPQTFDFSGDDDLWVFVDGKLVLDLGGAHGRTTGSINFNTKTITAANTQAIDSATRNVSFADGFNTNPNYVHTMTIYYMERGMYDSNLKFGFSFHTIPNQFWIDKKIRTKDIINAGFYADNEQDDDASNKSDTLSEREGRFISKFEASYQDEKFTVEHKYGSSAADATAPASGMKYTIDNDTNTYTTPAEGTYPIKHDLGNAFIGQFTKGQYFNLKETFGNKNKYVYTPVFSVWDQANNNKALPYPSSESSYGDNTSGYTFRFSPTTTVTTGIENTNIKARFENYMVAHTLTLKKEITNATDTNTPFTIQVMFDFENDGKYIAYPLYCDVDGVRKQLSNTGTIDITAGQILEIEEIPENAKIQVVELLPDSVYGYRYNGYTLKNGTTDVTSTSTAVTKGAEFVMGNNDMTMTFSNKKPDNRYTIKYTYPSYGYSPMTTSLYGNQSYTVSGVFTEGELKTYLKFDESGNLAFKTDTLKKGFINKKAPLEDNFLQTLSFADSTISDSSSTLGWHDGNYSCEVTAKATTDDQVSVSFNLPYNVDTDLVAQASDGKVAKITAQSVGAKKISCFDWYVTSGKSRDDKSGDAPVFVKAPLIIHDGNTAYYFQYWSVKKASTYGMKAAEYTRCYDYEFNLSLFMDTVIEPVYGTTWAQKDNPPTAYDMYGRFDPEKQIAADSTNGISIAFLENSRNQYNLNGGGSREPVAAADVIYSDFLLSFNNFAGKEQLNTRTEGMTKAGLVIEAVGYLTGTNANGFDTTTDYRNETNIASEGTKKADIKSWVEGGATNDNRLEGMAVSQFDVKSLDNKNRIQYYYALNNRKLDTSGNLLNTLQNRYKVFRAYAYIGDVSGDGLTNVKVSDPVYFTIYDMASNGLANNATDK